MCRTHRPPPDALRPAAIIDRDLIELRYYYKLLQSEELNTIMHMDRVPPTQQARDFP